MVEALENIKQTIEEMQYVTVKPVKIESSFYKLKDGTVIEVHTHISRLIPDQQTPPGYAISSNNIITSYVKPENRRPGKFKPDEQTDLNSQVIDEDMDPIPLREEFSIYELSNKMKLSVKVVVGQVQKTSCYTRDGEPTYLVNVVPVIKMQKNP